MKMIAIVNSASDRLAEWIFSAVGNHLEARRHARSVRQAVIAAMAARSVR